MSLKDFVPNATIHLSSLPYALWEAYRDYLWNYTPNSWVGQTAYTFRVLAFLLILPFLILTLLVRDMVYRWETVYFSYSRSSFLWQDISAYIVARSLGIVDAAVASTSDKSTVHKTNGDSIPSIHIQPASSVPPDSPLSLNGQKTNPFGAHTDTSSYSSSPSDFFASSDTSLKLSGVGVFSPATSSPPSPTLSRKSLAFTESSRSTSNSHLEEDADDGGIHIRRRKKTAPLTELEPR